MREFGIVQFCPPAFAAIDCFTRFAKESGAGGAKKLIDLFDTFEKYHFINNVICERVGNEVEKLYADACVWYAESNNFIQTTDRLINELKKKLATLEEFVASFKNVSYASDQISLIAYIFDRINNHGLDPGQCVPMYNPDKKLFRKNFNIEHILPQTPDQELKVSKEDMEAVDNIGNLLVIYFKDNSSLGNASPAAKIKRLKTDLAAKTQNLSIVAEFIRDYDQSSRTWNAEAIKERAATLATKAYKDIWKIK